MAREKRGKLRVSLHAPASITYANAENVAATLLDLSEDGLAIQSERRLPPRCKVYFQFNLPRFSRAIRPLAARRLLVARSVETGF